MVGIAPQQDSSGLNSVRRSCSSHDRERFTFWPQKVMKSLSDCNGHERNTRCTDFKNTQTTICVIAMHHSREVFFKTRIIVAQLLIDQSALSLTHE